ncbi:TRAP transporter small permease subunit [Mesorhizobium sp. LHD-90]|uniref:TRAP transporter small permease n=1 Tax=Mesorhizobium sp. LHD-90 TaxID=3071414 RepID=UPI0027DF0CB1|nr:TRAP transporter small permease subunit [Mesorhizobium sp. LHD-90]MDQ6437456.1 TRAP transporter small permease subunit [Mesorhizobium sp. LHD-90]
MTRTGIIRLFSVYERAIQVLAGASMAVIVAVMVVQVIARYVFNSSLIWAEELCRYILIWQTFLFVGYAYYRGELVVLDLFSARVSPRTYMAIRFVTAIPIAIFLYLIISAGLGHALRFSAQMIPAIDFIWMSLTGKELHVPVFWIYVAVPLGCAILLAHFLGRLAYDAWRVAQGLPIQAPANGETMT